MFILLMIYLGGSLYFYKLWGRFFLKYSDFSSPQERRTSLVIMVIASLFWLIVVPISYVELLKTQAQSKEF